jgi:2-keto-4-pentenoate hydratase/2-oxohepta-3-ene-1,7-dioic acid hydratase in catechol pathway
VYEGDLFGNPKATGETLKLADVTVDIPCTPSKMVAMVDNFHALVTKLEHAVPAEPLYFLKGNNSFLAANQVIRTPKSYSGKVVYEGELGIVIGKACHEADEAEAAKAIFGYTCINDVTAIEILNRDPGYAQWTRSKSFNTFGVFGPYITTDVDPNKLSIKTILNDQERQNYPVADMIFPPAKLAVLRMVVGFMCGSFVTGQNSPCMHMHRFVSPLLVSRASSQACSVCNSSEDRGCS